MQTMEALLDRLLIVLTTFGAWSFKSSGKKQLKESLETRSEPNTPKLFSRRESQAAMEVPRKGAPSTASSQPIAIKGKRPATTECRRACSQSLPKSNGNSPDSIASGTPRSFSSSQYSSMHHQIWEQAFRNCCR